MPEGPEVYTVVSDLQILTKYRCTFVDTFLDNAGGLIKSHPEKDEFHRGIVGASITLVSRRGKWIMVDLNNGLTIVIHLGMFGSITLHTETLLKTRITLYLLAEREGRQYSFILNYDDSRCFGRWYLWNKKEAHYFVESRTGPDAITIDLRKMREVIRGSNSSLAETLVDQHRLSGIGNIYRSEILNLARVSPFLKCGPEMVDPTIAHLTAACRSVLQLAVKLRGSSIADYVDGYGKSGGYTSRMRAYNREGEACMNQLCTGTITARQLNGRSLYWCPRCQAEETKHGNKKGSGSKG